MGENVIELTIKLFFFWNSWTYKTSSKNLQAGVNSKKKNPTSSISNIYIWEGRLSFPSLLDV